MLSHGGSYFDKRDFDMPAFIDIYAPHYPSINTIKKDAEKTTKKPIIFTEYNHSLGQSLEDHKPRWEMIERMKTLRRRRWGMVTDKVCRSKIGQTSVDRQRMD